MAGDDEPRRRGLLPSAAVVVALYGFLFHQEVRAALWSCISWAFIVAVGVPSLCGAMLLTLTYAATVCVQPNSLGPIDWYTAAWLQGLLAGLLLLCASPLTNELAALGPLPVLTGSLPAFNLTLPVPAFVADSGLVVLELGGADVSVEYSWWLLGALYASVSTLVFALHIFLSTVLLGWCCDTPALWRHTRMLEDDAAMAELRDWVGAQCETQRGHYGFGMALRDAWRVSNPELDAQLADAQADMGARGKPADLRRFFHGTRRDSASAITRDGFRLPAWHGMFGRGVYFADCPLKSLRYTGWGVGRKYMLVCDVEMGRSLVQRSARPEIDPEGGVPIGRGGGGWSLLPSLEPQPSFDSVSVPASWVGVRVPEYIVYQGRQAVPRYVLAVEQVRKGDDDELREGSGAAWRERRACEREAAQVQAEWQWWWEDNAAAGGGGGRDDAHASSSSSSSGGGGGGGSKQ